MIRVGSLLSFCLGLHMSWITAVWLANGLYWFGVIPLLVATGFFFIGCFMWREGNE
jgi:hypothetical protein